MWNPCLKRVQVPSNTRFGKVTLMLPVTPRMISQDAAVSGFPESIPTHKNKNKGKKRAHSILKSHRYSLREAYVYVSGEVYRRHLLLSRILGCVSECEVCSPVQVWFLQRKRSGGGGGGERSGSEGVTCSVGGPWDSADWSIREDASSHVSVKRLQRQLFPGCVCIYLCEDILHTVLWLERGEFIIPLSRMC